MDYDRIFTFQMKKTNNTALSHLAVTTPVGLFLTPIISNENRHITNLTLVSSSKNFRLSNFVFIRKITLVVRQQRILLTYFLNMPRKIIVIHELQEGELRSSKDCHFRNIKIYKNGKVDSLQAATLPKTRIISKKASSKSCSGFNFNVLKLAIFGAPSSTPGGDKTHAPTKFYI